VSLEIAATGGAFQHATRQKIFVVAGLLGSPRGPANAEAERLPLQAAISCAVRTSQRSSRCTIPTPPGADRTGWVPCRSRQRSPGPTRIGEVAAADRARVSARDADSERSRSTDTRRSRCRRGATGPPPFRNDPDTCGMSRTKGHWPSRRRPPDTRSRLCCCSSATVPPADRRNSQVRGRRHSTRFGNPIEPRCTPEHHLDVEIRHLLLDHPAD